MKTGRALFPAAGFLVLALSASPAEARRIYVRVGPPRVRVVEVRPVAPSPRHVWIGGFHGWHGWYWIEGRWR
jgi:hypothetical protein